MKKIKTLKRFYVLALLLCLGSIPTFAGGGSGDQQWYEMKANVIAHSSGNGTVYASENDNTTPGDEQYSEEFTLKLGQPSFSEVTFKPFLFAKPDAGFMLKGWKKGTNGNLNETAANPYQISITGNIWGVTENWYAVFAAKAVITEYQYATFVAPCDIDFTGSEVKAFAVSVDFAGRWVTLEQVTKVAKGTPLVIKSDKAGTYGIDILTNGSTENVNTQLTYSTETITCKADDNVDYYYLGVVDNTACFRKLAVGGSLAAGKCYFTVAKGGANLSPMTISLGDDVTGISGIEEQPASNEKIAYNLAGQRVDANTKGIVIINGKKYLNR